MQDTTIRDFLKMLYDIDSQLKYVLLFGDGSYDPKIEFQITLILFQLISHLILLVQLALMLLMIIWIIR